MQEPETEDTIPAEELQETSEEETPTSEEEVEEIREEIEKVPEEEEEYDGERFLTVSLFPRVLSAPKWRRSRKAIKLLKSDIQKYIKYVEEPLTGKRTRITRPEITISPKINEEIHSVPRKIRVKVAYKIVDPDRGRVSLSVEPL
ncbi:MAG: hypothetical protein GWO20_06695 [Candidatus Korarchaeota archaeon]|nr:hypothetical protein [Candidatus Korarchaeota archaeon]NIU83136.1 hypothetical protein [Candidatus Thorarchaeota archaeon]NIW13510.1 hypothetical protein [Candidatus Thorarchaeota archaeon]NIW51608.1 hypothetical protein [Candidatus Korarchaeota archaeon]